MPKRKPFQAGSRLVTTTKYKYLYEIWFESQIQQTRVGPTLVRHRVFPEIVHNDAQARNPPRHKPPCNAKKIQILMRNWVRIEKSRRTSLPCDNPQAEFIISVLLLFHLM